MRWCLLPIVPVGVYAGAGEKLYQSLSSSSSFYETLQSSSSAAATDMLFPDDMFALHDDLHRRHGRVLDDDEPFVIETCGDVPGWFGSRRTDPTVFFGTYFDCSCSGDFDSSFEMSCEYKQDRCFEPYIPISEQQQQRDQDEEDETYCVYRTYKIEFLVQEDFNGNPDYIPMHETICHSYPDGPGAGNTICLQGASSCSLQLKDIHSLSTEQSVEICNDLDLCRETLPNLNYTNEEIEKLCYRRFWNGQECFSKPPILDDGCRGFIDDDRLEIEIMVPDCSDVEPCAIGVCRIQPFEYTTPDFASLYYTECSDTQEVQETSTPVSVPDDTPVASPTVMIESGSSPSFFFSDQIALTVTTACFALLLFMFLN